MAKRINIYCHCGKGLEILVQDDSSISPERCPSCGCEYAVKDQKDRLRIKIGHLSGCELQTDHDIKDLKDAYYHELQVQGEMALLQGNFQQGAMLFKKAVDLKPNEAEARIRLCKARVGFDPDKNAILQDLENAEELISKGVSRGSLDKFNGKDAIQYVRGSCYYVLNDVQKAESHLQNALNINPDHVYARRLLDQLKEKGKDASTKSGGCFIATTVYGSDSSPEVKLLRRFRDDVLIKLFLGERLIRLYYQISPHLASSVEKKYALKKLLAIGVFSPLVWALKRYFRRSRELGSAPDIGQKWRGQ
jgi:tetratricopeptide (TPR) repeat protein